MNEKTTPAGEPATARLHQQIEFILEIDCLKGVLRQTLLTNGSRRENSAEHSWHLAVMALVLQEHAATPVDLTRVLKMLLVHDIVEIDAGDTFCYDEQANEGKLEREHRAADRLFGKLPAEQAADLRTLWEEFEGRRTADAKFAAALDRLQPLLSNLATEGHSWQQHGVALNQVIERTSPIGDGSNVLWEYIRERLDQAVDDGILAV